MLAAVTSLPNAVAAVYLASRGRGVATLSTALNSNTLNVVAGLLLPGVLLGLGHPNGQVLLVTAWYGGLSLAVLLLAWRHPGLTRRVGGAIIAAYVAFAVSLIVTGYATSGDVVLVISLGFVSSAIPLAAMGPVAAKQAPYQEKPGRGRDEDSGQQGIDAAVEVSPNGHKPPGHALAVPAPGRASLLPEIPSWRLWLGSVITAAAIAAIDATTGRHVILIGLLIAGPCIAVLTGKWLPTALAGVWACGLAVLLGLPDGIWATATHIAFVMAVAIAALAAAAASVVIGRARH